MRALKLLLPAGATDFFQANGYLILERALSASVCKNWKRKALSLWHEHARQIHREAAANELLQYQVVTGDVVKNEWPELMALYSDAELKKWIGAVTGSAQIYTSPYLQSAINLNVLAQPGDMYRWHFDAVAYTLLLYLSNSAAADGGAWSFIPMRSIASQAVCLQKGKWNIFLELAI